MTRRGITFMPTDYVKWKADVALLGIKLPERFGVRFHFAMPASWPKRKRAELDGQPHRSRPDLDNILGGLMDACLADDSAVYEVHASKIWSAEAGIEVWQM